MLVSSILNITKSYKHHPPYQIMPEIKAIHEIIEDIVPYYKKKGGPEAEHKLVYDSSGETLEPIYFFILDLMNDFGLAPEKLVDNFSSTPGGQHFSETGMKATRMQEEAMKIMGQVNTVLRSILNIIYDLKDFNLRLAHYNSLKTKDEKQKEAAILALKQIWMDKVDITKQQSSIKAMALGQAGYQTLIDAFLIAKNPDDVDKIDLNDRVKRILKPRVYEFNNWIVQSEKELRKRYAMQKTYLKSQVSSLKLYSQWVKPYLKASQQLQSKEGGREPNLVNMFNTIILELTLLGKSKIDLKESALSGKLPLELQNLKTKRNYYSCVLVDFNFRAIPRQGVFVGKSEITFRGYTLNDDEIEKFEQELKKSEISDVLNLVEGMTTESLEQLQGEIDTFLEEPEETEKEEKDGSNPFMALIGAYNKKEKKQEKEKTGKKKQTNKNIKPDDWTEKNHIRKLAAEEAEETTFKLFDVYKKAHGMPSYT